MEGQQPWRQTCRVPESFLQCCRVPKAYIALADFLAAGTPIFVYPELFVGASITPHVDSMTALSSMVLGASRSPELARFSTALHCLLSLLRASAWWEWVPSVSNPADGGTPTGMQDTVAITLGVELREIEFPPLLFELMESGPSETLALFSSCLDVA